MAIEREGERERSYVRMLARITKTMKCPTAIEIVQTRNITIHS